MKTMISDNGDYAVFANLSKVETTDDVYCLQFTSLLRSSKSLEEQHKFTVFLTEKELKNLKSVL